MYFVLTVHWKDPQWIKIQQKYLKEFLLDDYRVFTFLNDIDEAYHKGFDFVLTENINCCRNSDNHAVKLNLLAQIACNLADDNDTLLFLDGDAFPINDLHSYLTKNFATNDIIAVRREENNGDCQPHPIFTAIKVKTWKNIKGDWGQGHYWTNSDGIKVTDTGGKLLAAIEEKGLKWHPILRSNKRNLHPVMFGVYGDVIYHHGAGFRKKTTRYDKLLIDKQLQQQFSKVYSLCFSQNYIIRTTFQAIFKQVKRERQKLLDKVREENTINSNTLYKKINENMEFYKQFI